MLTDNKDAVAVRRAAKAGIKSTVVLLDDFEDRKSFDIAMADAVKSVGADLVCLAGFMRILSGDFLSLVSIPVLNIHPSLLPLYKGLSAQKQAIEAGAKESGCTVHYVDEGMDTGPIIMQAKVPVYEDDTEDILSARILREEHKLYPKAVNKVLSEIKEKKRG
jgi:phosphoribosylglycinamide formyltransferase-1